MPELKCALADSQIRPFAPQPTIRSIAAVEERAERLGDVHPLYGAVRSWP